MLPPPVSVFNVLVLKIKFKSSLVYFIYIFNTLKINSEFLQGLVVPVLRNVENMDYAQIELEVAALGEKVRLL